MGERLGQLSLVSCLWRSKSIGRDSPAVFGTTAPDGELLPVTDDFRQYDELPRFGMVNLSANWSTVWGQISIIKNLINKIYPVASRNQALQF